MSLEERRGREGIPESQARTLPYLRRIRLFLINVLSSCHTFWCFCFPHTEHFVFLFVQIAHFPVNLGCLEISSATQYPSLLKLELGSHGFYRSQLLSSVLLLRCTLNPLREFKRFSSLKLQSSHSADNSMARPVTAIPRSLVSASVLVTVLSIPVKRQHDHRKSDKRKHFFGACLQFQRLIVHYHHGDTHGIGAVS